MRDAALPRSTFPAHLLERVVPSGWLFVFLAGWLGLDQLLLWRFLGFAPLWAYPLATLAILFLCRAILHAMPQRDGPTLGALLLCIAVSAILLILSGEGRFFYANVDWQVRFAVLRDMAVNPWPFAYAGDGGPLLLRAPIGMFLLPALIGKAGGGTAADMALLAQNALLIGALLALGSTLFDSARAKAIALAIVIMFSGLDALGRLLVRGELSDHLEHWAFLQYSSTITLLFWVPQHGLSGWIGAVGFLFWRSGRAPLAPWLALMPFCALWSPLGLVGGLPFAALAGVRSLLTRSLRPADILLPALASLIAIPSLLYLASGAGDGVGIQIAPLPVAQWALFLLLEVGVFAVPLLFAGSARRYGRDGLILVLIILMTIPLVRVGWSIDFMMRASITALAILAVLTAEAIIAAPRVRPWLIGALLIGVITPWHELRRSVVHPPAPAMRCDLIRAWDVEALELGLRRQGDPPSPKGTYLAPVAAVPAIIRPAAPTPARTEATDRCWDGHWYYPGEAEILVETRAAAH